MAAQILTMSGFPAEKVLVGIGRPKVVALLAVVEGLSNISISIVLVSAYGAIGAALGTLVTSGVLAPVKLPLACRATGLGIGPLLRGGVLVPTPQLAARDRMDDRRPVPRRSPVSAAARRPGCPSAWRSPSPSAWRRSGRPRVAGALRSLRRGERLDEIVPGAPGEPAPPAAALPEAVSAFATDERHDVARRRVAELARELARQREAGGVDPGLEASLRRARRELDAARAEGARLREGLVGADGLDLALAWLRNGTWSPDALRNR